MIKDINVNSNIRLNLNINRLIMAVSVFDYIIIIRKCSERLL